MNRIKELRNEKNMNQTELGKLLGLEVAGISKLETGRVPLKDEYIIKLANFFNVSTDYLLGKSSERNFKSNIDSANLSTDVATVFIYGIIPAGVPIECIEDIIGTEDIPASMLKGGKQFFGLKIKGDSMSPEYLNGDTIILEKVEDCENGQDCVVMVNGNDGTFKRVFKNENGIVLQPLNSAFSPMIYTKEQIESLPVRIIGKVVELRRKK